MSLRSAEERGLAGGTDASFVFVRCPELVVALRRGWGGGRIKPGCGPLQELLRIQRPLRSHSAMVRHNSILSLGHFGNLCRLT